MHVFGGLSRARSWAHSGPGCAVTIGNFDGVHRGHQAMLALLTGEARQRGLRSVVLSFEPHPRDFFARRLNKPEMAPTRVATVRDATLALQRAGADALVILRFNTALAGLSPQDFVQHILLAGLNSRYVLVGDDFRFGAQRAGDYAMLDAAGVQAGFDVARMMSYEVHGIRVSSSAVRQALAAGDMARAASLLGRPYAVTARVQHGRKLGRELGFRTLNQRFAHPRSAAMGIFVSRVLGLGGEPLPAVSSLGVRPSVEDAGRVLLETHVLDWPTQWSTEAGYGQCVRVELLHKLHDERRYDSLEALRAGIAQDTADARAWHAAHPG
jgi:riboflavin kinase / FMN adenylyltransferase